MLTLNNLALRRGGDLLFEDATFTIHRGNRVGFIGANGSGKTSLFKMILSELEPDMGSIEIPQGTRIAHMAQEVSGSSESALDYVLAGDSAYTEVANAIARAEADEVYDNIAALHEKMDSIDGYSAAARAEQLMAGLGFLPDDSSRSLSDFSGGWRIRLNLARTLMQPSDLLLLDEPTNHLDLDAIIWLSDWIRGYQGTLLLISHDREFLNETVQYIAYLHHLTIELFTGNYSQFELIKAARLAEQQSNYEKQQREIAHMQDFVRRFRAKATKARQAQSRIKALERLELIAPAHIDSPFAFDIQCAPKISSPLVSLQDAVLGYDDAVLEHVNLSFEPGDRFGLLGINGAGKSTLIKTLEGSLPLLAGSRVEGTNLKIGYFSQHQMDELNLGASAFDHILELSRSLGNPIREQEIRNFLGGFNFRGDKVLDQVSRFSGGEKARLALSLIAYTRPNLLLMDEPTNHLDIDMRQALTVAMQTFDGAILLVSHDRHLMANTVDQFILIADGSASRYEGDLTDYRFKVSKPKKSPGPAGEDSPKPADSNEGDLNLKTRGPRQSASADSGSSGSSVKSASSTHKDSRKIRTRLKTLESRLERVQRKLAEVTERLGDPDLYQKDEAHSVQDVLRDQLELNTQMEALETEWLLLSEQLETS